MVISLSFVFDWFWPVTALAYDVALFFWGVAVVMGVGLPCLGAIVVFALIGQFFRLWPTVRHCRHVAGEPGHDSRTFWPLTSMEDGRVLVKFSPGRALTNISHLVVSSFLDPLRVLGAISTGVQNLDIICSMAFSKCFLFLIGMFSMRMRAMGGSLPFGGRMGSVCSPIWRVPCSIKVSASLLSSKKTCMNFTSARNLTPMAPSGSAASRCLPSSALGILERSRKAEVGSPAGGILVD